MLMTIPPRTDGVGRSLARMACDALAVAAAVLVLAGCGAREAAGPTQVVASVNGGDITELQVNQALERQVGLKPDQIESVSRKIVAGLVEQEIILRKARELKLDREQQVVQNIEALKREIVTKAYIDRMAQGAAKPSPRELQAYYDANPALFGQRRIYTFQELSVQVSGAQKADIEAQLASLKSPAELEAYLKTRQIPARSERTTTAAENLPLPLLQRITSLKSGQGLIVPANGGLRILLLVSTQESPVTEEQARPAINAFLLAGNKRQAVDAELAALRTTAQVDYFGKYADLAASAVSPNPARSKN